MGARSIGGVDRPSAVRMVRHWNGDLHAEHQHLERDAGTESSPRTEAIVAWCASMLVVWGGSEANGERFDPTIGVWRPMAPAPIAARARASSATTSSDRELYVWGGTTTPDGNSGGRADGAAYSPETNSWRRLARSPLSAGITSGVWTGREVLYGPTRSGNANGMFASTTAATYDPSSDTWRRLDLSIGHPGFISGWDGERLLLFAKGGGIAVDARAGAYTDIPRDQPVPTDGAIVSTGTSVLLLGEGKLIEYTR